jgi:hypothetical protein
MRPVLARIQYRTHPTVTGLVCHRDGHCYHEGCLPKCNNLTPLQKVYSLIFPLRLTRILNAKLDKHQSELSRLILARSAKSQDNIRIILVADKTYLTIFSFSDLAIANRVIQNILNLTRTKSVNAPSLRYWKVGERTQHRKPASQGTGSLVIRSSLHNYARS